MRSDENGARAQGYVPGCKVFVYDLGEPGPEMEDIVGVPKTWAFADIIYDAKKGETTKVVLF
eukprot:8444554-Lingulodinium_polyedra.AAC.1